MRLIRKYTRAPPSILVRFKMSTIKFNYHYLAASEAGRDVAERVTDAYSAAENVTTLLPPLREKCSDFENEAAALRYFSTYI